jgi:FlaA1/EpsC-like NDP-sugar epimerase
VVAIRAVTFVPFRLYEGLWRYTGLYDLKAIAGAVATSTIIVFAFVLSPFGPVAYPRSILIGDAVLLAVGISGIRLACRAYEEISRVTAPRKRVLIFGAGSAGELVVRDMRANPDHGYSPVGFIDDDRSKVGGRIHGVPVLGTRDDLGRILEREKADEVLIAIPGAEPAAIRAIVRSLQPHKIPIKTIPGLRDLIDGKVTARDIRSLAVEDLLARAPIGLDPRPVEHLIRGRRVMVTGAGGSIGSELCRQIAQLKPSSLVMFERYENTLHAIRLELEDKHHALGWHPVIGDVTDEARVAAVMERHRPEIVFHAAAHKHVPLMEENPCEAIKNNVRGTRILARAAEEHGVDRFLLISTDKAVNPTNVMGASKRLAELVVQSQAVGSGTSYSIVRFGNVLGSNGSVVPRFLDQIRKGGPLTVTHPDVQRFFMLIPEAVQLVLHAAGQAESGAIYVLEMGDQVKLVDMARDLIRLAGFVPDEEIPIEFIGLRPGEKLYEELVGVNETVVRSKMDSILRVRSRSTPTAEVIEGIYRIEEHAEDGDVFGVRRLLKELIPEFEAAPMAADAHATTEPAPSPDPTPDEPTEQFCPECQSANVHRSKTRTIAERFRRDRSNERLYRCTSCGWRGWLTPLEFCAPLAAAALPDLRALDDMAESVGFERRSFSPRNLN